MDPIWRDLFRSLKPNIKGKLSGEQVRAAFQKSSFNPMILSKIWDLSDHDHDDQLNEIEFMTFMYFSDALEKRAVISLPESLPSSWWFKLEYALASDKDVLNHQYNFTPGPNEAALLERQVSEYEQELNDLDRKISLINDQIRHKSNTEDLAMNQLISYQNTIKNKILKIQQQSIKLKKYQEELNKIE